MEELSKKGINVLLLVLRQPKIKSFKNLLLKVWPMYHQQGDRNADSQAPPELLNQKLWGRTQVLKLPQPLIILEV